LGSLPEIDMEGRALGTGQFPADPDGYATLPGWMQGFGDLVRVGIEGTGAYGAGLARLLARPARSAGRSRPARPQDPPFAEQVRPDR
jgi:transposase